MSNEQPIEAVHAATELERAKQLIAAMTPEAYLDLESALNASFDANAIPEAGGIAFTEFEGAHGGVIHATARANHPTRATQMLLESLAYLKSLQPETHWRIPDSNKGKAPAWKEQTPVQQTVQQPVQQIVQQTTSDPNEPQYVDVNSEKPVAAPQAGSGQAQAQAVMQITKIGITPKPDGRVDVQMYSPGHKWPDLKVINWTAQSVFENLIDPSMGWGLNTLQVAGEYTGNYVATWEFSTTGFNQKGEPYKDVKRIALA